MPHDFPDHEVRPPPYNTVLVTEQGIDTHSGYNAPNLIGLAVSAYQSIAVTVDPGNHSCSVQVGWIIDGDVAGTVVTETKTIAANTPDTLLFQAKGHLLDHVRLTGGTSVNYAVTESNQLPLAKPPLPWAVAFNSATIVTDQVNANNPQPLDMATGSLITSDTDMYSLDAWTDPAPNFVGFSGLGIHAAGTYRLDFGMIMQGGPLGPYGGNPLTLVIAAFDNGGFTAPVQDVSFGSWYWPGHADVGGPAWRPVWTQIGIIGGTGFATASTGGSPLIISAFQHSGLPQYCYPSIMATQISTDTYGY